MKKSIPILKIMLLLLALNATVTSTRAQSNVVQALDNEEQIRAVETNKFYSMLAATPQTADEILTPEKYKQFKQYFVEKNISEALGNKFLGIIKMFYNTSFSAPDRLFVANILLKHYPLNSKQFPSAILYADKQALILNQK
jgi:bacillopeptidase F (M6 metalloprotease family)